jgi:TRAP-type mannitol/chloroaromatic compound transport system permease small subunit
VKAIEKFLHATDWLNAKFGWVVAFIMVPLTAIMIYEILMRYFLNSPSLWAYETSLFTYGGYIVLGGAYTHLANGHVNVDVIWGLFSVRGRAICDLVTSGFVFLYLGVLFWMSLEATIKAWQIKETTMTYWAPIYYPLRTTVPVACGLFILQALAKLIRDILTAIHGKEVFPPKITVV